MIRESGIIEDWIAEEATLAEARGEARGQLSGKEHEARNLLFLVGSKRFGEPDRSIRERIEAIGEIETLEHLVVRCSDVHTWRELLD